MGKCPSLIIFLASSLFLVLQNLQLANATKCYGSIFNSNSSYAQNRREIFSTLAENVVSNGGFYNASHGQNPNRVHVLGLCARGYEPQSCISCIDNMSQYIRTNCPNHTDSFMWGGDDEDQVSCFVRSSNNSTLGNLVVRPPHVDPSRDRIQPDKNLTLFLQEWEATVNRTFQAATKAETSSAVKYYSAEEAEFTEFPTVYMMMQCTPDLSSRDCKQCLEDYCVKYFRKDFRGRLGGMASNPSCFFRWDLYSFHGAFDNVTRVPAPPRPQPQQNRTSITDKKGRSISYQGVIAIIFVVFTFINILVFIGFIKVHAWRRKSNNGVNGCTPEYSDSDGQFLLRFDLSMILLATNDFSPENKLGQGGFGTVYKGILPNGQEIAVKRLTKGLGQGDMEFKNEVSLLTRLQHKNLVKLLGFCNDGDEEVLVYEFVPNSSLDYFIFDEEKRSLLTWEVRFRIIEGVARGLLYLHEDSQLKIIHRDLKTSNILLDSEMNPKVADFGTARLFDTDETQAETKRIAGTRGYMAPEYLNHGQISAKSDVFSFGVVLLEIISGEKNSNLEGGLAAFAWKRWNEGKPETIVDHYLKDHPRNEIIKLIQVGLLCVQENAAKRPTMSSIITWLGSETIIIPLPRAPAFTGSQSQSEDGTMSMSHVITELSSR